MIIKVFLIQCLIFPANDIDCCFNYPFTFIFFFFAAKYDLKAVYKFAKGEYGLRNKTTGRWPPGILAMVIFKKKVKIVFLA